MEVEGTMSCPEKQHFRNICRRLLQPGHIFTGREGSGRHLVENPLYESHMTFLLNTRPPYALSADEC